MQTYLAFISEDGRVAEELRPHYQHWVALYLNHAHTARIDDALLEEFLTWMGPKYADWRVRQARQALPLYSYYSAHGGQSKPPRENLPVTVTSPAGSKSEPTGLLLAP